MRVRRTFIDEHQAKIIPYGVFLVDFSECWCQVEASQEESDGNCFAWKTS